MAITEMTESDLLSAARRHDAIHNEGGEGYNPYRAEMERREAAAEAARPLSRDERKDQILRQIEAEHFTADGWREPDQARLAELRVALGLIEAAEQAEFVERGGWTRETTQERRIAWNDFILSIMVKRDGKNVIEAAKVDAHEKSLGWTKEDLKRAIKINKL